MYYSRRELLKTSTAACLGLSIGLKLKAQAMMSNKTIIKPKNTSVEALARDEGFWNEVADQFDIDHSFINLENGYYGIMPNCVFEEYKNNLTRLNKLNSYYLRTTWKSELESIREYLAKVMGVLTEEIVFTRNGTDSMQKLISGYNQLKSGDQVLYSDLDFHSCQDACEWLKDRRGAEPVMFNIPEPATKHSVLEAYQEAFNRYPKIKLVFLTHMNNKTGLVLPVKDIINLARLKGIDAIVDAAHSWGQLDFNIPDLGADFVGLTLHKWIHAPLGLGCIYIRKERLQDIDRGFGSKLFPPNDIRSRVLNGTDNMAVGLTLPTALDFHLSLGTKLKEARLKYLRNQWVQPARMHNSIDILTPDEDGMYGAITSFRIKHNSSPKVLDNIVDEFWNRARIFVVRRTDIHNGDCIRVTPAIYTKLSDIELFRDTLLTVV